MKPLLFVHAGQGAGATLELAKAALSGARDAVPGIQHQLLPALQAGPADLLQAAAVIFVTPEKFGYMAGALKDFFDRSFYPLQGKVAGLGYALIVSAGNDGRGAIESVERIVRGFPLKPLAEPMRVVGEPVAADLARAAELGAAIASGVELGIF